LVSLEEGLFGAPIMASAEERATAFKNEGNKAFTAHDWFTAIDFYTKAIELNPNEPTYYSNRAQVGRRHTSYNKCSRD
jgi:serine/threonine-protein phosphatase 5